MNPGVRGALGVVVLVLTESVASAQGLPSGELAGIVVSAVDGRPLPGVTVTVRSPALQGRRETSSADNGHFLLPNLPPGEYTVELRLEGARTITRPGIRLGTSQRQELIASMSPEGFSEKVVVSAPSEQISMTPQGSTTLTSALILKMPIDRTIDSVILLAPGVNQNGPNAAITISGGESYENTFSVNGIQARDNGLGTPEPLYIEDAIAEVTTLTSAVPAEYGRFTGGAVNALTKSGGNAVSGSIRATLLNDAWSASTHAGEERVDDVTPVYEATLGGPLWRDRLWLFGAGRFIEQTTTSMTAPPTSISFPTDYSEKRYELKLTASPAASQTFTLAYTDFASDTSDTYFPYAAILSLDAAYDLSLREELLLVNYTGALSDAVFAEASYGRRHTARLYGSTLTDLIGGTVIAVYPPAKLYNSPLFCAACPDAEDLRNSEQGVIKVSFFAPTRAHGSHTVVAGVEAFEGANRLNNYQSGSDYSVEGTDVILDQGELYPVFGPGTLLIFSPVLDPAGFSEVRAYSAFVNDTWRLSDRLTFNLGLRWDKNDARDAGGARQSDYGSLSPRLAVAWEPAGSGTFRLTASYGRYVSAISENQMYWASPYGASSLFMYFYDGPPINTDPAQPLVSRADALRQVFQWFGITAPGQFPGPGIDPFYASYPGVNLQMRGGLKPQRADEVTLGIGGALGSRGSFRADAIQRTYADFYTTRLDTTTGTVTDPLGNVYDLGILTHANHPLERRYAALRVGAQASLGAALEVGGWWTWSRTRGNQISETPNAGPYPPSDLAYPEYWQAAWHLPVGDLPQDVRHRIRLWAAWELSFLPAWLGRLTLSPLFSLDSGRPYGARGDVLVGDYVDNPGYALPPYSMSYWFTARDAFRTPTVTQLDVALDWRLRIGGLELFVQPQVLNLFNEHSIASNEVFLLDQGVLTAMDSPDLQPFDPFRSSPAQGVNYRLSPTFGEALGPEAYQQPRTFRVSLGVRF